MKNAYKAAKDERELEIIREIALNNELGKVKDSWKLIRKLSGYDRRGQENIKGKNKKERLASWREHFEKLLVKVERAVGEEAIIPLSRLECDDITGQGYESQGNIEDGPFNLDELKIVIKSLKCGKATSDILKAEIVKYCGLEDEILEFCNQVHINGEKPKQLSITNFVPVPKKFRRICP